jgi:RHS repeat-associated protein
MCVLRRKKGEFNLRANVRDGGETISALPHSSGKEAVGMQAGATFVESVIALLNRIKIPWFAAAIAGSEIRTVRSGLRSLGHIISPSLKFLGALTLALLGLVSTVWADDDGSGGNPVVFHSQTFVRTKGSPNSYAATFNLHAWVVAPFTMHVVNGDPDGRERVSSATVLLNGTQVLGPSDVNQNVATLDLTVSPIVGSNSLQVTLDGKPGSEITITISGTNADLVPPLVTIVTPANGSYINTATPRIDITYSKAAGFDDDRHAECDETTLKITLDGVDRTKLFTIRKGDATTTIPTSLALTPGLHTLVATLYNEARIQGSATSQFTVVLNAPSIQILQPVLGAYLNTTTPAITIQYSASGGINLSSLKVLVNGADLSSLFTKTNSNATATLPPANALPQGANQIVATIQDLGGNQASASTSFNIDTTPPTISFSHPAPNSYFGSSTVVVAVQYADDQAIDPTQLKVTVDGLALAMTASSASATGTASGLANGAHLLVATIKDLAGNAASAQITFYVDTTIPTIHISQPAANALLNTRTPPVLIDYTDVGGVDLTTLRVFVNGVDATSLFNITSASATAQLTSAFALPDGSNSITAQIANLSGTVGKATSTFLVDTTPPTIAIQAPAARTNSNAPTVTIIYSDATSGIDPNTLVVTLDGADISTLVAPGASSATGVLQLNPPLVDGTHVLTATVKDRAGNQSAPATLSFVVDTTPPVVSFASPTDNSFINNPTPTITLQYTDGTGTGVDTTSIKILLQQGTNPATDITTYFQIGPQKATGAIPSTASLSDGTYVLSAAVNDLVGNTGNARAAFVVDTVPPTGTIQVPAANAILNTASVAVTLLYQDDRSGVDTSKLILTVDGVSQTGALILGPTQASGTLPALQDGIHTIQLTVFDRSGNSSGVISQTFTTDTTPPTMVISVSPPANAAGWNNTNVTLTSVCGDATSGVATCPAPLTVTTEGANQVFSLTATDNAGNTAVRSVTLNIAKTPPQIMASGTPAPNASGWNNSNVIVSFICTATTAPLATCPPPETVSTEGAAQIISGTATDLAGNSATAAATVNLDKTAPSVAITSPNANAVLSSQTVSVAGTVADSLSGVAGVSCNGSAAVLSAGSFSCTLSLMAGPNNIVVQATDVAGNSATSQIAVTVQLSTAAKLVFSTEPTNGTAGSPLGTVLAQVQDANGNVVTGSNAPIIVSSTAAGVGGMTTVAAVNGVATFSDLVFTVAGSYTLTATSPALTSATSTPFTISAPGFTSLVFTTQPPPQARTGQLLLPGTQVTVEDGFGNVVSSYNGPVAISISNNPGRATLGGTLTQNAVSGVATFLDLSLNTAGNGYTLLASAAGQSATSAQFNVRVSPQLASCLPSSSLGVLLPASGTGTVTAYVPNGSWSDGHSGIQVVPVEGGGSPALISTPHPVNSCASNSVTGETVCVANTTDVYLISGSTLNSTLTSGSSGVTAQFDPPVAPFARPPKTPFLSGGWCLNCGVAINAVTNTAAIEMGLTSGLPPFYSGLQFLDLTTNTFSAPLPLVNDITEEMLWDPIRNLILLPSEYDYPTLEGNVPFFGLTGGNYDLIDTSTGTPTEFGRSLLGADLDAAAEDCTTGIALSGIEGTLPPPAQYPANLGLFISDLTQAAFTTGSPGTWSAPGQFVGFPEFLYLNYSSGAGTPSVAVPPGSHLAVVTSEGAGDGLAVVELPSTSGSGTPGFGDYAVAALPRTPDGQSWSQGFDPHTITAYVSPNTGRPMAIFANSSPPTWLAVIDLQGLLDAPRKAGVLANNLSISCPNCTHTVDPDYDLLANNVVRYIGTPPQVALACPITGQRGQQGQQINLTGNHTHWTQGTTTASYGPGIAVESFEVSDATHATAVISIDPNADLGPRTVTIVTGGEVATADNPYMITALASVGPSTGQQGLQNLSVTLTGQFTNWVRGEPQGGITQVDFGAGIIVTSLTVNSPTSMTAVLNINPSAPAGPRPVTITNTSSGCDAQIFSSAFAVTIGALILESVNPNSGQQGQQNLSVALAGNGTNWAQGTTTADFGPGITVASLTVTSPTSATAVLNISPSAPQQPNTVTITTGSEVETRANGFAVTSPVFLVSPTTGQQGQQNLQVFISDEFTYWVPGLTTVSFGPGITVTSVTVDAASAVTAMLNISPTAPTGPTNVTVTTGTEVDTLSNGFTVTQGTNGVPGPPEKLAFIAQPTNTTAGQPISAVQVAVEDAFGNVIPSVTNTITIVVGPNSAAGTLAGTTQQPLVNGVATFGDLAISKAGDYTLEATGSGLGQGSRSFAITAGPPSQLAFTNLPSAVASGQASSVTVVVEDRFGNVVTSATNLVTLALGANPGGATLSGASTVSASNGLSLFSGISINKTGAGYSFTASSPGLTSTSSPSFVVNPGTPSQLVFLTQPSTVSSNGTLNQVQVAIEDASGSVVVTSNDTVHIALYQNPSGGTLSGALAVPVVNGIATFSGLSIDQAGNGYALEATLASCCFAISSNFNVLPTGPAILSLSPNVTLPGTSVQVTITALNTHFVPGQTTATFGPGVSVGGGLSGAFGPVQVTSATTAMAQVSVAANATPGLRTVAVRTGSEEASLIDGFAVNGSPFLSSLSPSFSPPGQSLLVTIKGVFTNFRQGTTQATFGPGISVGGAPQGGSGPVFVTDSFTATAQLTLDPAATPGLRAVTVQTGGEQATLQSGFLVLGAVTGPPPMVSIDSPTEGAEVTSQTLVTGTVTSPNLASWTLDYQGSDSTIFTTFATGTSTTVSGTFDPTLLLNGLAVIRLTAVDQSGQTAITVLNVAVTRKLKVGVFTVSFNDLTIPVAGIPIQITRTYDSRFKAVGDFGFGWTLSIKSLKASVNGGLGMNWQGDTEGDPLVPVYCITPAQNHIVTIRLPGDQLYQFQPVLTAGVVDFSGDKQNGCQYLTPLQTVDVSFVPVGATPANATLTAVNGTALFVSGTFGAIGAPPAPIQLVDSVTGNTFDPDQFQFTMPTGQTFLVSRTFGVQSVTDTNSNTLTITSAGITSSTGKGVSFTRDSQNRITTITDPMGHALTYAYDAVTSGDLSSFTDQLSNTSTFTYDSAHDLISYTDPRGIQPLRNIYDDSGRLIEQIDASGHVQDFNHLTATNTEAWTDFLGNTTMYVYDGHGNVIQETDPMGNATSRTFDANDNLLTETNALGQTRSYTYDSANNPLTITDPLGNTVTSTYNSQNQPLSITDPNNHTQTFAYDANGNLLTMADAIGNTTKKVYSGGLQISTTDPLGHTINYGYDGFGNLISASDPAGTVTTYSYDANGNRLSQSVTRTTVSGPQTLNTQYVFDAGSNLVKTTLPDGSTVQKSYDPTGRVSSTTDELGRTTSYAYDNQGHLTTATYPDGTLGVSHYDANGNRTGFTAPSGVTSSFIYDALNRVTAVNASTGSSSTSYDSVGRIISTTNPNGDVTQSTYDGAGRRITVTNALHQVTSFAYDAAGNQISGTDANGNTTTIQRDSDNRVVKVVHPDGTSEQSSYNAGSQIIGKTDPAGNTTQYGFDSIGRLVSVTDAMGHVTTFAYDLGNRISQRDANGNTTTFQYDQRGRRTRRTLPSGQTESFAYDAAGNVVSHTDFNGKTTIYVYDSRNRLLSKVPDPSFTAPSVTYTYTASGNRAAMIDATGTTTYQYDSADRLVQVVKPNGILSYAYDSANNLISLNGGGAQVNYTYDALSRLAAVSEMSTGTTNYTYDGVGNLAAVAYPNGVSSSYAYDAKNELTTLLVGKSGGNFAGYNYAMDAAGHRLTVAELNGRMVHYSYDRVYRLTSESVSGAPVGPNGNVSYTYDAVGNRMQTTSTLTGIPSGVFNYDADDRLGGNTYDADGDTISSGGTANTYDFEDRLIQHGGVTLVYDGDGNRVSKTVAGVTTKYLVDDLSLTGFPQVISETSSDGSSRTLVYGLERISQRLAIPNSNSVTSFYTHDGHGSVRALTDPTGAITDTYDYDAFGNLTNSSGSTPNEFRFAGEQFDSDLGLYYNRARYFDPTSGRFWTMDPLEGNAQAPTSLHRYLYASADPVNRIDPSGNQDLEEVMADVAIQGILSSAATSILQSPLGQGALGLVESALLPSGFFDTLTTLLHPSAVIGGVAAGGTLNLKGPFAVTATAGQEVLWSPNTNKAALFVNLSFGAAFASESETSLSVYAGLVYHTPNSQTYATHTGFAISIPSTGVPTNVATQLEGDLDVLINEYLSAFNPVGGEAEALTVLFNMFGHRVKSSSSTFTFFGDFGEFPEGGIGGTISVNTSSAFRAAIVWSNVYQELPRDDAPVQFDNSPK